MKHKLFRILLPAVAPLLTHSAVAQDPFADDSGALPNDPIRQIGITVEYFQLDHTEANSHVRDHLSSGSADATALHETLSTLADQDKAQRIGSTYLVTRSGQRAKVESIVEHIYPTKFDPPEISSKLTGPFDNRVDLKTNLTPTGFETRNAGFTIEVDPILGADGVTVDLNIATGVVEYMGDDDWGQKESRVSQPVFNSMRNSIATTSLDGDWTFIGQHRPARPISSRHATEDSNQQIIVLARLDVLTIERGREQPGDEQRVISAITEYFEVNAADAAKLLARHLESGSSVALRDELTALQQIKKATLLDSACLTTRSGQRAKTEAVNEWIYPTEVNPPAAPEELTGPIEHGANVITPLSYSGFATRNVGTTLELDPVLNANSSIIDVNIAPEMVAYIGKTKHGQAESQAETPVFSALKTSSAVTVRSNAPLLISVYLPIDEKTRKPDPDRRVFLFLTATTLKVGAGER